MEYGGEYASLHRASEIKKGDPSWDVCDHHQLAQVDYAQGKDMILIGFLIYRSHDVSERPAYMIDN